MNIKKVQYNIYVHVTNEQVPTLYQNPSLEKSEPFVRYIVREEKMEAKY